MANLGYCCINLTLGRDDVRTSRTMRKATFQQRGLDYASDLALQNINDLHKVIAWNIQNNVRVYRITSDLFPWESEYQISDLPDYDKICKKLIEIGQLIKISGIRTSFHPSHFVKLGSDRPDVVDNSIANINHHAEIFDLMDLDKSHRYPINVHIGSVGADRNATIDRFRHSIDRLSDSARARFVVENDDKQSLYSVRELVDILDVPITFDYFHHSLHTDGVDEQDAFLMAYESWPTTPLFHYSDSRRDHEDPTARITAHADYVYNPINDYGFDVDIDLEAKAKELALFKYRENHD